MVPLDNSEKWIVRQAAARPAAERAVFLDGACGGDPGLRQRVEASLAAEIAGDSTIQTTVSAETALGGPMLAEEGPGTVIGRYKLLEKIGEGGFGAVYVAEQKEPVRRKVALKIIKLGMDTRQVVARFEAERQALALMDHPNIAKVLDGGATELGRPYFVMELVRGVPITLFCEEKCLGMEERLRLFILVCQAIQHAHQKGIIHRDIKPSNILVTLHDGVPVPKVIDFGIAKATAGDLTDKTVYTQFQQFIGTPAYMSPEQAAMSGLDIDTRSDIYSLGVLLYELLAGSTPFDTKELMRSGLDGMLKIIREREPVRPSTRLSQNRVRAAHEAKSQIANRKSQIDPDLDWIVMKALEKDRTRRYETANGLAADINRFLGNEPVVARPPSQIYQLQKFIRRNRTAATAAVVVFLSLAFGLVFSSWEAVRADRASVAAQAERDKAQRAERAEKLQRDRAEASERAARRGLYVANMNFAQAAWDQNNVDRVRNILRETAADSERGFEWYYWQRLVHLPIRTFRGHGAGGTTSTVESDALGILSVAFSPDGKRLATGGSDCTARLWDVTSGNELRTLRHPDVVRSVAFSPDGQRIVTGSRDSTARIWDVNTGKSLRILRGHAGNWSATYSPDGQRIVTACDDGTAKIWDAIRGQELLTLRGHSNLISSAAFSRDGRRIVTASKDATAKVWEAAAGTHLLTLKGHADWVNTASFSPDDRRIVTGSDDGTARVWDAASGQQQHLLKGHGASIGSVAFSADGQRIVTGSGDGTAKVWDAASGEELLTLKGHGAAIVAAAFSPDGQRIATGGGDWKPRADRSAKLWDLTGSSEALTFKTGPIQFATFSPDGRRIITPSFDRTAKVWDVMSGRELFALVGHGGELVSAAFSPDGQRIATAGSDHKARIWDAVSAKELITLQGHSGYVQCVAFSPDGQQIVTASADTTARVWDARSGNPVVTFKGHTNLIWTAAFSPDGQRVVTASHDGTARVWDARSGKELLPPIKGHSTNIVDSAAFSPDGQRIVTASSDGTAKVWDASNGKELLTLNGHAHQVAWAAFSPDGKRIVTASADFTARVWDALTGNELLNLKGHSRTVKSAMFSPDGQRIVTASWDHTARVWAAATPQQVATWQQEEKAAEDRLAASARDQEAAAQRDQAIRTRDPGAIKRWLVLAPIPVESHSNEAAVKALDQEQLPHEAELRVHAEDRATAGGQERVWKKVPLPDYLLDFNQFLGKETDWSVAYAVCYIHSDADQTDLLMKVGSDDEAKIYLNGKAIYRNEDARPCRPEEDLVEGVSLRAGVNVLVFKVVNEGGVWQGSIRLTDAAGEPVSGIRVTFDPEGKD